MVEAGVTGMKRYMCASCVASVAHSGQSGVTSRDTVDVVGMVDTAATTQYLCSCLQLMSQRLHDYL